MSSLVRAALPLEGLHDDRECAESAATPSTDPLHISILDAITVLLVSFLPEDHTVFAYLLRSLNCSLHHASTCADAAGVLRKHPITVIVSEQTLPDGNWRRVQSAGCFLSAAPELIVISADSGSSAEALACGEQDVLRRPLQEALIPGAIVLGYLRWRRSALRSAAARIPVGMGASPARSVVHPWRAHLEHPWP